MDNFRPKYAPPQPENPMAEYMDDRMGNAALRWLGHGAGAAALGGLSFADDGPVGAWLLRAGAVPQAYWSAQAYDEAQNFNQGRKMWSNTGMPGRPVPENQNALMQLMRFNQMYGGDGN